ncbi:DEAD/DEAH box helicase family protein [Pseudobutyrivibrio sp. MD2005]|uniref:DEAD/DEAH box helicase family protein n=1 Tax=Pseudobutyrivibrio sp. MD2005 TaxID=1410616 RepID=UPI00047FD923|nr:DEAD/DEAH box helicase family protein [Pseudobutyrivibrio sp. MD2005]
MVEPNFEEIGEDIDNNSVESIDLDYQPLAMTGDDNKAVQLYAKLLSSFGKAKQVDIIVSFLMESGVKMLLGQLEKSINAGTKIRILTGNYLGITQPSALYLIKHKLGDRVELRFYNDPSRSFHPKAYIFHYDYHGEIFIGSSNVSRSALTSGIEWNYRFTTFSDERNFNKFCDTFEDLYQNHSIEITDDVLREYSKNWHKPAAAKDLERYDESELYKDSNVRMLYEPRGAQIEALCALENTRAEGATKALVQAATGVGKTYLAAFDSKEYEHVLFVAHREEILKQAAVSFRNIRNSDDYGFFNGDEKCTHKSVIFASVATLGNEKYLNAEYFSADYFDYIVVDEFHHAVNDQYKRIVDYFKPKFMLGLTATPERMDGRSIYELCDYNVPYEISLFEAINKGMLVPFHYYGIYDDTDYSKLHVVRGRYDEKELNETYIGNVHRHDLIYKYYRKYESNRALGFCCSRDYAEEMAKEFCIRGIPAVAVYSNATGEYSEARDVAITKLKAGEIKVIFAVDMFNEGVDITSLDMVMFLRPTESPVVFLQQLGRGLRKSKGKNYLNVLDFIGNYEKAGKVRSFLSGKHVAAYDKYSGAPSKKDIPDDCLIDFDMRLIDLFKEMERKHQKLTDLIDEEFYRVKELVGHRPSRLELFTHMSDDIYQLMRSRSKDNIFKDYLKYLHNHNELTLAEEQFLGGLGKDFIKHLENEQMTKVYKMPVLMAIYNDGDVLMQVHEEQLLATWKRFFNTGSNWKDLDPKKTYNQYVKISDSAHIKKIFSMPVHFLINSGKGFFVEAENGIGLCSELNAIIDNPILAEQMKDVIEYKTMDYYSNRLKLEER